MSCFRHSHLPKSSLEVIGDLRQAESILKWMRRALFPIICHGLTMAIIIKLKTESYYFTQRIIRVQQEQCIQLQH